MRLATLWGLLRDAAVKWRKDNAPRLGAALAFYTLLSLAPLLVIVTAVAGAAFGPQAARGQLVEEVRGLIGEQGAATIEMLLANAHKPATGVFASAAGMLMLLVGAAGVFSELHDALNTIWGVDAGARSGLWRTVKARLLSFGMVLVVGFLLLVSLVVSAGLTGLSNYAGGKWPALSGWLHAGDFVASLAVITVLFALLFKFLPDTPVAWGDVWLGAAVTALLFSAGKVLIGLYLGSSGIGSTYGAAGALAVFLVWIYYSAQVFFFGAEFTAVRAGQTSRAAQQG